MFTFQDVAKVFAPAAALERVLTWWMRQPGADLALTKAAEHFFGGLGNVPLETEEERAVDMLRFLEWYLLDEQQEGGGTVLALYTAQAPESERAELADLAEARHDRWIVKFVEAPKLTVAPASGGTSITVANADLARDAQPAEQIVGRFYRWGKEWLPSVSLFFLPADEAPTAQADGPLDALATQRQFFMVDPAEAAQFDELVGRLFQATAKEDEASLMELLEPEGEVALVYDAWGWPGVRLVTDWGSPATDFRVVGLNPDMGAVSAAVVWNHAEGERAVTLWFYPAESGWKLVEAMPELDDGPVNPAFAAAQDKGVTPPWRGAAPDAVEEKLRRSIAGRKLPLLDQGTIIKAWRMTKHQAMRDAASPEAWAAAVEAFFYDTAGIEVPLAQVADTYGAKKSLVKERVEVLAEAFNQLAGQPR